MFLPRIVGEQGAALQFLFSVIFWGFLPIKVVAEGKPETALNPLPRQATFSASHSRTLDSAQASTPSHPSVRSTPLRPSIPVGRALALLLGFASFLLLRLGVTAGWWLFNSRFPSYLFLCIHSLICRPPRGGYI